jgi:hypothetical protein
MTFHSCRSGINCLQVNALRVALLLSALSLPTFAMEPDGKPLKVLADALNGLSEDDLKMHLCHPGSLLKGESIAPDSAGLICGQKPAAMASTTRWAAANETSTVHLGSVCAERAGTD